MKKNNQKIKIEKQAESILPTKYGRFRTIAYASDANDQMPAIVLIHEHTQWNEVVNVRVHSECMTGDVFGSYRCECGEQLDQSMNYVSTNGGIIIYLRQEGRGIGLINKLHAYSKQDEGLDTAEANEVLGFGYDERTYEDAITILEDLKVTRINLITNNPDKIAVFDNTNIELCDRISIHVPSRKENVNYLYTKKNKFGHFLDD